MEQRLELLKKFLEFWFSPWGAYKTAVWEQLARGPFSPTAAVLICKCILEGDPEMTALVRSVLDER